MKTISEWNREASTVQPGEHWVQIEQWFKSVRDEALEAAKCIAIRDGHTETADKIAALRSLP